MKALRPARLSLVMLSLIPALATPGARAEAEENSPAATPPVEDQIAAPASDAAASDASDPLQEQTNAAGIALQTGDLAGARRAVDQALAISPEDTRVMNLHAAVLTYERKLSEARKVYSSLLENNPEDFALNWNMAEVDFLEGNYFSARQRLLKLRESRPRDEMLGYKIFLTHLFDGNLQAAREELEKIPFPSDTAAYYYGRAALALREAKNLELEGKKEEAARSVQSGLSWLADAGRIFRLQHNLLFADSLIEKKLITREQVTGLVPVPEPQPQPEPAP